MTNIKCLQGKCEHKNCFGKLIRCINENNNINDIIFLGSHWIMDKHYKNQLRNIAFGKIRMLKKNK